MGICYSNGVICDFAGPYTVNDDGAMAFGNPTRYLTLSSGASDPSSWDDSVRLANATYGKRMHNICCDNCHSHVACALNDMAYMGFRHWNMVLLALWMFFFGAFDSWVGAVKTFGPFAVFVAVVVIAKMLS